MVYRFTILSDEVDEFLRVIDIDPDASFLELHNAILDSVKFEKDQITSFFTCNDSWEKEQEVTLIEMDTDSEYDNLVMESTRLSELLEDEEQKLLFVFDMLDERAFFIELTEIILGKEQAKPKVVKSEGVAPQQSFEEILPEVVDVKSANDFSTDASFYGDEEYGDDELDDLEFDEEAF